MPSSCSRRDLLHRLGAGGLVDDLHLGGDRHDLVLELALRRAPWPRAAGSARRSGPAARARCRTSSPRTRRSAASASRSPACARCSHSSWTWCLFISFCTSEIDSTPPATKSSPSPAMMRCAASAMVCRPEEQKRFTVMPGTVTGQPARIAIWRAMLPAGRALGVGAAHDHVLDLVGVELGALERGVHHVAAHRRAVGHVERAAPALAERRARGGNDDGLMFRAIH